MVRRLAHDSELEQAPEKHPTSSVQEVLREPVSHVMPRQVYL